ncbi:MAG: hypothetical protein K8R88_04020 [Armatimonadetes bacterium]|nr:hypothetical protein [Armatimonadota bacterium]
MRKVLVCLGLASFAAMGVASRQSTPSVPTLVRVAAIWKAADERMERQTDRWFNRGDFPRVSQLLRIRLFVDRDNYERVTDLGWMLKSLERYDEELALYVAYRMTNADKDPDAAFPEANFYFERKMYAKVPPLLEPTLKQNPHRNSYRIMALSYEKQGMFESAKRVWVAMLARFPDDGQGKVNLERVERALAKKK